MSSASPPIDTTPASEEAPVGADRSAPAEPEVIPYEFGKPKQLGGEKAAFYQEASSHLAAQVEKAIREWAPGFAVEADPLSQIQAGDEPTIDEGGFDTASLVADMTPRGMIATENSIALALIGATLGGGTKSDIEPRRLTAIEARVLDLILTAILDVACRVLLLDELSISRDRDKVLGGERNHSAARVDFNLRVDGPRGSGVVTLGLETEALERFSDAIERRVSGRQQAAAVHPSPATAAALQPVPVHLSVNVGRAKLTAREVVELRQGDVIRTRVPMDSELVASAGDTDLFEVRVGNRGDHLIAEIVSAVGTEASR